ncbi:p53-induced protein with a death domain [Stylophora pistillata]|uniref:p53-induced protein with a death domain n=2 Tax=Stylophora pistillata TaxID=50429 RepID=A0A2B4R8H7_STYPI|nr:p53-induced protein with a death domain [Stylophora pistillata]
MASLELSLTFSEPLLKEHSDLARCYNAIGNTFFALDQPRKALEFYEKAYRMQENLAGSENHLDMPMYKNQIGTAYEGLEDYAKAEECYSNALSLLEELKLSGYGDEAHFQRNLANALMFQEKYKEAIEPSERAYSIRKKLLGDHRQTVRSIFQQGVLQANLEHPKEALNLFLEAWEMEKKLGVGNHSEVWRKIITGVEDMCDWTESGRRKKSFRKEAFEFCQRFWEEQKASPQFTFNEYNKGIVDALSDLADDEKDKVVVQKGQLRFYEARCNANEKEFQEEFDLETDNDALCIILSERDNLLDEMVELSSQLHEQGKLVTKYKMAKVAVYKMCLERVGFLGNKEEGLDKASLKIKVEELYKEIGQEGSIMEFRERLLASWRGQWEEGKSKEKTEKIGVDRKETIEGILNLCQELKKVNMHRRYGQEALSFYEDIWEMKHAEMKDPEMKKHLRKLKELASSIGDDTSEKLYKNALQALNETGKHPGAILRPRAKEEEKDSEEEEEEIEVSSEGESEVEAEMSDDTDEDVQTEDRTIIFKDTVIVQGGHWDARKGAALLVFPPDFVVEDTTLTLFRWKPSLCSPPLQPNEAVVSNVLELSAEDAEGLQFNKEVTVGISHSGPDLRGYEVVIKTLTDAERNEWKDIEKTVDFRSVSDLKMAYRDDFPDYVLPVAETKITQCCIFAVVCRLKAHKFTITSQPSSFSLPGFPLVKVHFPSNSVAATEEFHVTVTIQEFRRRELRNKEMLAGPILSIQCSKEVKFQEPVTVQLPLSLRDNEQGTESLGIPDLSLASARILFLPSNGTQLDWIEITDDSSPWLDGTVIKFNVKHFSRLWGWIDWCVKPVMSPIIELARSFNTEDVPQVAVFTACLPANTSLGSTKMLRVICSSSNATRKHIKDEEEFLLEEENAWDNMVPHERAYVFLSGSVVQPAEVADLKDFYVRFEKDDSIKRSLRVHVVEKGWLKIEFYNSREQTADNKLCKLEMDLPPLKRDIEKTPVDFFGVPLDEKSILQHAPFVEILAACGEVLEKINHGNIFRSHLGRNDVQDKCSFYKALASLPPDDQQKCFEKIVECLQSSQGTEHIGNHLIKAKALINQPPTEGVLNVVAEKLRTGSLWKKLASKLKIQQSVIDNIQEDEEDVEERCREALKKWRQKKGEKASSREIMLCLTNMGYGNVNWHIMEELDLVTRDDMPPEERE